jgi:hypothetical protein
LWLNPDFGAAVKKRLACGWAVVLDVFGDGSAIAAARPSVHFHHPPERLSPTESQTSILEG